MYNIVIIGAGPAGSTLARLLSPRYKVLLLDRRNLNSPSEKAVGGKACGGLLAPDAQRIIAQMGLALPHDILVDPQIFAVKTMDLSTGREQYYQRFYFNMDREKFDRWLFSLIPGSVEKITEALAINISETDSGYEIIYRKDGKQTAVKTKNIIGADGAQSLVRKKLFNDRPFPRLYISLQEWYHMEDMIPFFGAVFDPDITDYYSWTICKNNHFILGSALEPGKDSARKFNLLKEKMAGKGYPVSDPVKKEGALIYRPCALNQIATVNGNAVLVGEAAGWISPSSAEGFSYAMRTGLLAASCLNQGLDNLRGFEKKVRSLKGNIIYKNLKAIGMYSLFLRNIALRSGMESFHPEIIQTLCE